jgi:ATP-dependent RNA helicase DDX10/DBP4
VKAEGEKLKSVDVADKETVRAKRKEKKEKRKRKEREEREEREMFEGGGRVALLGGQGAEDEDGGFDGAGIEEDAVSSRMHREGKKERKWFQDSNTDTDEPDSGAKRGKKMKRNKGRDERQAPETLEDLEAMAEGFLG